MASLNTSIPISASLQGFPKRLTLNFTVELLEPEDEIYVNSEDFNKDFTREIMEIFALTVVEVSVK